ncbi:MAG: REP-associated tyrosine transposase [Moraxellaceae bacterium]
MESRSASARLRLGRHSGAHHIYLVTTVTRERNPAFSRFECSRLLIQNMHILECSGHVPSLAFVVMPDHLHWLFRLYPGYRLESVLQRLKGRSAVAINRLQGSRGAFWQDGYHDHALRKDADMLAIARYIVMNPVRAGLVRSVREYPHWDAVWL